MKVPYIPEDAPFSEDQRSWLGGFLAGLHSRIAIGEPTNGAVAATATKAKPIDIVYGTQTGNSEELASDAATLAKSKGYHPRVTDLDSVSMDQLSGMENLIVVISTYGEGEMPDNAQLFWDSLSASTAPRLPNLKFGVLALGDTSYEHFCRAGKLVDTRLEQLGAQRLAPRLDCDVDYEEPSANWLRETIPDAGVAVMDAPEPVAKATWSRRNPYQAKTVDNRVLSGEGSAKEIRHIAFELGDSELTYETGDALGVIPINQPNLVRAWLTRLHLDADASVPGKDEPLGELLTRKLEITTPSRELIEGLEPVVGDEELSHVLGTGDKEAIDAYLWGKDSLDLLNLNPNLELDVSQIVSWLKPLQHRAYSISSSPKAHPGEVHLTVAAVRWMLEDREHRGVCSTYLADMVPVGDTAGVFMMPNKAFGVPDDDTAPMIMVGPGTGIAPFRAFLEERRERGATGTNWLFFGDQHRDQDFIYEDEIEEMSHSGLLTRLGLAFSRDQKEKVYVQHRMQENGKDLYGLLQEGGYFFVCGDAIRMAKDVDAALHTIIVKHGAMSTEAAAEYVNQLKREKRYVRDVY